MPGFAQVVEPLGVVVDLTEVSGAVSPRDGAAEPSEDRVLVSNQQKRVDQLVAECDRILRDGVLQFACARRLRGRLLFAKSVCYGRFG